MAEGGPLFRYGIVQRQEKGAISPAEDERLSDAANATDILVGSPYQQVWHTVPVDIRNGSHHTAKVGAELRARVLECQEDATTCPAEDEGNPSVLTVARGAHKDIRHPIAVDITGAGHPAAEVSFL